jgi:hypothetical protein
MAVIVPMIVPVMMMRMLVRIGHRTPRMSAVRDHTIS